MLKGQGLSLRVKAAAAMLSGLILVTLIIGYFLIDQQKRLFSQERQHRVNIAVSTVKIAARRAVDEMATYEFVGHESLDDAVADIKEASEDILYVLYLDKDGEVVARTHGEEKSEQEVKEGIKRGDIIEISSPVMFGTRRLGTVRIGFSLLGMRKMLSRTILNIVFILIGSVIVLALLLSLTLQRIVINPISRLSYAVSDITSKKDLARTVVENGSHDEIGVLISAFNRMTGELKKSRDEIEEYNRTLEQKVEERTKKLKETQIQLVQSAKLAAVGQLGAGVAHELNNPLGGILGYAQFMLEKFTRPDFGMDDFKACQRYIESIERESNRCRKIVENLLKFSRRPVFAKPQALDIAKAIEETLSIVGHQLALKNVKVITEFAPNLLNVTGIVNQLQQVFTNLILNAQQAMPEGGELKIIAENINGEEGHRQSPGQVKIEFTDTGSGIPAENIPRIFEPFFTTREQEKGTGLGLSVSYQIIRDHKGNISVDSEAGTLKGTSKGARFTITLPGIEKKVMYVAGA